MSTSAAAMIDARGGPTAFAIKVKRRPGAVRAWKHRNYFPREAWPEIMTAYPDISLDTLMAMEVPRAIAGSDTVSP